MKTLLAFMLPAFAMLSTFGHAQTVSICDRTPLVREAIMEKLDTVHCDGLYSQELADLTILGIGTRRNPLTSLQAGDFAGLTGLQELWLNENQLTTLPAGVFDGLTRLRELHLDENRLTSLPAGVFDGLTRLRELYLDENPLTTLPAGLFDDLTSLEELNLIDNQLTALPAGLFDSLTRMNHLTISDNPLTTFPAGLFDSLTRMQHLWLDGNQLTTLPAGLFDGLTNLQKLQLHENRLTALPAGLFDDLTSLQYLFLHENRLTALPEDLFDGLTSLQALWLGENQLTALPDGVFDGLTSLENLGLADNRLTALPDGVFDSLTSLQGLWLGDNQLTTLPAGVFDRLTSLERLELHNNYLAGLTENDPLFARLPSGVSLALHGQTEAPEQPEEPEAPTGNFCDRTPQVRDEIMLAIGASDCAAVTAGQLAAVEGLCFSKLDESDWGRDCRSSYSRAPLVALKPGDFDGLTSLEELHLAHNRLTALPAGLFDSLARLNSLNLDNNRLAALPAGLFDSLARLGFLELHDNQLSELPAGVFDGPTRLATLFLGNNRLTALPDGVFDGLTNLSMLHLNNNRLTALPDGVFDGLTSLGQISLDHNRLTALPAGAFDGLASLQYLWLNGNQLTALPDGAFDDLASLELLYLNDNQLATLQDGAFDGLTSLRGLYLHRNQLTALPAGAFDSLASLQGLSLLNNRLTALPDGVFDSLTSLHWLQLNNNHLVGLSENDPLFARLPNSVDLDLSGQTEAPETPETLMANATRLAAVPLLVSATDSMRQGFVRIINESDQSGSVRITAYDDAGTTANPIEIQLGASQAFHFNAGDLENGNANKGINEGVGSPNRGDWRLAVESALDLRVLSFVRTGDGFLTAMHDVLQRDAPDAPLELRFILPVPTFNPASNTESVSKLRLVNTSDDAEGIFIYGVDDQGNLFGVDDQGNVGTGAGEAGVSLTLAAGEARTLSAQDLENGAQGLTGTLGDGAGKWRLILGALHSVVGVSLLDSASGHLSNISTENPASTSVPLLVSASDSMRQGFVRIINGSNQSGSVRITAYDDAGTAANPIEIQLGASQAFHFNAGDLENGNANKGINEGVGSPSRGDWRLAVESALNTFVFAYVRTGDGFLTAMHDVLQRDGEGRLAAYTFNPGQNRSQVSSLRLVNTGASAESVSIEGVDDQGASAGLVRLTLNAGEARTLSAQDLEGGAQGLTGSLGDGAGKWRLFITASDSVEGMSLLESPTGHLTNLSTMGFAIEGR